MVDFGFLKKKEKKDEEFNLDLNLYGRKMDLPSPPSPTDTDDPNFPGFPNISDERKNPIMPPLFAEEKQEYSKSDEFKNLNPDWQDFAKLNVEPRTSIHDPEFEVKNKIPSGVQKPEIKIDTFNPLFLGADSYLKFIDEIGSLRVKLHLLGGVIGKIDELREKEDIELKRWHQNTDEIRKKLLFIDDALFESRG